VSDEGITVAERTWKYKEDGKYWFVPEDDEDDGETEYGRSFPFFIYEVDLHELDDRGEVDEEPIGSIYTVCNGNPAADDTISRRFPTLKEAQRGAEEWFEQTRPRQSR
jgi:hypothetical protein